MSPATRLFWESKGEGHEVQKQHLRSFRNLVSAGF